MAGPSDLSLGGFAFESYGFSFTDRQNEISTNWSEVQVAGSMNVSQWTGGQGETLTIRGVLFPHEFGGLGSLSGLKLAAGAGQVLPLVTLDTVSDNVMGMWFIEGIGDDASLFLQGKPLRDAYRIKLKKYQTTGSAFRPVSVLTLF